MNSLGKLAARGQQSHISGSGAVTGLKAYAIEILVDDTTFTVLTETLRTASATTVDRVLKTRGVTALNLPKGHILYPQEGYMFTAVTIGASDLVAIYESE